MLFYYYVAFWFVVLAAISQLILILYKIFFSGKPSVFINIIKYIPLFMILFYLILASYNIFCDIVDSNYSFYWKDFIFDFVLIVSLILLLIVQWKWNMFVTRNNDDYKKWHKVLFFLFAFILFVCFCYFVYMCYVLPLIL